jgi:hypothetical protein
MDNEEDAMAFKLMLLMIWKKKKKQELLNNTMLKYYKLNKNEDLQEKLSLPQLQYNERDEEKTHKTAIKPGWGQEES